MASTSQTSKNSKSKYKSKSMSQRTPFETERF